MRKFSLCMSVTQTLPLLPSGHARMLTHYFCKEQKVINLYNSFVTLVSYTLVYSRSHTTHSLFFAINKTNQFCTKEREKSYHPFGLELVSHF